MNKGDVHGDEGGIRAGFLWAFVTGESSNSRFLVEPSDKSSGPLPTKADVSLDPEADLLRFNTGVTFSSAHFFVLKSRTALFSLPLAEVGDLSGGVAAVTGNNKGGDDEEEMSGEDADTMVAKRGGTG